MKVLVRKFNDKLYTWEDVKFVDGAIRANGVALQEVDIVSIIDDDRSDYVKCSACNQIIPNNREAIEKHKNRYLDVNTCFTCPNLKTESRRTGTREYELVSGSTYMETTKCKVDLRCSSRSWYSGHYINTEEARNECAFKRCASADMNAIEDTFTRNPGIFDDIITSDKIINIGYKERLYWNSTYVAYQLNGRNQIYALVNNLNIVDSFIIKYHNYEWRVFYSKTKNELYYDRRGVYGVWNPIEVSDNTVRYIKNKISELYV